MRRGGVADVVDSARPWGAPGPCTAWLCARVSLLVQSIVQYPVDVALLCVRAMDAASICWRGCWRASRGGAGRRRAGACQRVVGAHGRHMEAVRFL